MLCIGFFSPQPTTLALTWFRAFRLSFFLFPSIKRLLKSAFQFLIDSLQKIKRHNTRSLHSCDALWPNYARFMFIFEFTNRFADGLPLSIPLFCLFYSSACRVIESFACQAENVVQLPQNGSLIPYANDFK